MPVHATVTPSLPTTLSYTSSATLARSHALLSSFACMPQLLQGDILGKVNTVLALDRNDPSKDELIKDVRKDINSWVAKYRREPLVSGRPSYGWVWDMG